VNEPTGLRDISRAQRADQEVLKRCMERRGYQVKRAE
jgi:hypothetical protein